tara:strand:- start:8 stop:703 length:696 start_codon:yes stop_codon:yes gene_type:complete
MIYKIKMNRLNLILGVVLMLQFSAVAQCDSIAVIMDDQGGFNYQWCSEEWDGQEAYCYEIDCPLLNPCKYQTVCFTLYVESTLPYVFTMDSSLGNMWLDSGVNCSFMLMDENCEGTFITPCWNNWSQDQTDITVDWFDDMDPWNDSSNEPFPWTCCAGEDWQLTILLDYGETYNFCISPSIHPENEGGGCMDLTIFSPPLLGLNVNEFIEYKETGVYTDKPTADKLRWLGR